MSLLNRLFTGRTWRTILLFTLFGLAAAAVWFLGAWFGFGQSRPLAQIEARVVLLIALAMLLLLVWFRLPLFLSATIAVIAIVWIAGPFLLAGKTYPLASIMARLVVIGFVILLALLYGVWRLISALATQPELLKRWTVKNETQSATHIDNSAFNAVIVAGVRYIRRIQLTLPTWKRFLGIRSQGLPWYLVLGTPNSGKTTMIFRSGQLFPMPEQLNRRNQESSPTEHCECLFTNDALFLDTAGKYSSNEKHARLEWTSLLDALKKNRPGLGINGVIITLSAEDILHKTRTEQLTIAANLRARLDELRQRLIVRFPVYITITKLDLLTGFEAFFRDLTENERSQIWGVTLPWVSKAPEGHADIKNQLGQEFKILQKRIDHVVSSRQQVEYDINDRKLIHIFPQDFKLLTQNVAELAENIFFASRFDETQFYPTLRGIYFVSSYQTEQLYLLNTHTLMQKWANVVNDKNPTTDAVLVKTGRNNELNEQVWGKSYFLKDIFSQVIIPDSGLVSFNLKYQSKRRFHSVTGHLFALALGYWLISSLFTSYHLNDKYLANLATKIGALTPQVNQYVQKTSEVFLPALLYSTQHLADYQGLNVDSPALEWRYGLYTGFAVSQSANYLHRFFLQHYFLPLLVEESHRQLKRALKGTNTVENLNTLKQYLMLTGNLTLDKNWLIEQTTERWHINGRLFPYGDTRNFLDYQQQLFKLQNWQRFSPAADQALIKAVRSQLSDTPEANRIWQNMKKGSLQEAPANLTLSAMLGADSPMVFTLVDEQLRQQGIPGLYTQAGWQQVVKKKIFNALPYLMSEDQAVMGLPLTDKRITNLTADILKIYLQEYGDYWQRFLESVRLIPVSSSTANDHESATNATLDIVFLRSLITDNSPIRILLQRAVKETTLVENQSKAKPESNPLKEGIIPSVLLRQVEALRKSFSSREQVILKNNLQNRFLELHQFVGDANQQAGSALNDVITMLREEYTRLSLYNTALQDGNLPPLGSDWVNTTAQIATWPLTVRNIVMPLLTNTFDKIQQKAVLQDQKMIDNGPGEICRTTLQDRYPFADSEKEVSLSDFERFFATDGVVDSWFKKYLADRVDTTVSPWHYKGTVKTNGLAFFEQVASIREKFFDKQGQNLQLHYPVTVQYLSPLVEEFVLNIDGSKLTNAHGPMVFEDIFWPGARHASFLSVSLKTASHSALPDGIWRGPWALFRFFDDAIAVNWQDNGQTILRWKYDNNKVEILFKGLATNQQLPGDILREFHCPEQNKMGL